MGEKIAEPAWVRRATWVACPLVGIGALVLLGLLGGWLLTLPWIPLQGPLRLLMSIPQPWAGLGAVVVGGGAGLWLAAAWDRDRLTVEVTRERLVLRRGPQRSEIARGDAAGVFLDGRRLAVQDGAGAELASEAVALVPADRIAATFTAQGWPWRADDPHAAEFRLWLEGDPTLPPGADVVLKARAKALGSSIFGEEDERRLRGELARLGVFVREEGGRQYWRRTDPV